MKHPHLVEVRSGPVTCFPHESEKHDISGGCFTVGLSFPPHHLPISINFSLHVTIVAEASGQLAVTCSKSKKKAESSVPGVVSYCTITWPPLPNAVETQGKRPQRIFGKKRKVAHTRLQNVF